MIQEEFQNSRQNKLIEINSNFVVSGGGLAGVCAAIIAARQGLKVVFVQDRPVLGGNSSSEVRLWALGATSHMGNNNRWARESGLINEILLENIKRNKEGNPLIFDTILLEKVIDEKNITLLLNTAVYGVQKESDRKIKSIDAFCSQNSTNYRINSTFFCDATGDGIVSFLAGASFRMGAESGDEFDEGLAPNIENYGDLLGHSLYFYTKDVGKPVTYIAPSFAIKNAFELPRIKNYRFKLHGCNLWWVEYGGRLDTIHQSEDIKMELWRVVYGIWDYIKNSGEYPDSENLTLEWVGTIPGKRESRRFIGDYMINQKDIVEQRDHYDRVAFGGWAMDLHPADGIYSKYSSCSQWHSKGVYSIPYRTYYSKDLDNLFLAGRIISASHVAFGSSRVMLTCALGAQAVGMAASLCLKNGFTTHQLSEKDKIGELQIELNKIGQSIPRLKWNDVNDIAQYAKITSSSELKLNGFSDNGEWQNLTYSTAQLLPLKAKIKYAFVIKVKTYENRTLEVQFKTSSSQKHFTPDVILEKQKFDLYKGEQEIEIQSHFELEQDQYVYLAFMKNENIELALSDQRITGIMSVQNKINKAVSNYGKQELADGLVLDSFELWTPERRPAGKNLALKIKPSITNFNLANLTNLEIRPTSNGESNAWIAELNDITPEIILKWNSPKQIQKIKLFFDSDYDNALECSMIEHPESEIPFIVHDYKILDSKNQLVFEKEGNFQAINEILFTKLLKTDCIKIIFQKKMKNIPVSVYKVVVYEPF